MRTKRARKILSDILAWMCYTAVVLVLAVFAFRFWQGVAEVRAGEATPAEMLEDLTDWMTGK